MIQVFDAPTADEVWQKLASHFRSGTDIPPQPGRGGITREILHAAISISNPRERWAISRRPAMNVAFAIAEVVWIMAGRNDLAFLSFWNREYGGYVGNTPQLHGAYGHRLRVQFKMDQLYRAYRALNGSSDSRQVALQIWDAQLDMPTEEGKEASTDIPCNVISMLKIRSDKLEWMQILRSNDLFLGLPHNIVQFTYLQEIMAGWLGIEPGSYNQISDSLHIYERDAENVRKSTPLEPSECNTDDIAVAKDMSDALFTELNKRSDRMVREKQSENKLDRIAKWPEAPIGYQNMLIILAAEAARRQSFPDLAKQIASRCTNPILEQMWQRWWERMSLTKR